MQSYSIASSALTSAALNLTDGGVDDLQRAGMRSPTRLAWLCCNVGGESERLGRVAGLPLTLGSELKQLGDKGGLRLDVSSPEPPDLPLPDHSHSLEARQRSSRRPETAKSQTGSEQTTNASMVLLHDVVQVFALPQPGGPRQLAINLISAAALG